MSYDTTIVQKKHHDVLEQAPVPQIIVEKEEQPSHRCCGREYTHLQSSDEKTPDAQKVCDDASKVTTCWNTNDVGSNLTPAVDAQNTAQTAPKATVHNEKVTLDQIATGLVQKANEPNAVSSPALPVHCQEKVAKTATFLKDALSYHISKRKEQTGEEKDASQETPAEAAFRQQLEVAKLGASHVEQEVEKSLQQAKAAENIENVEEPSESAKELTSFFEQEIDKRYELFVREQEKGTDADAEVLYRLAMEICALFMHSEAARKHKESQRETELSKSKVIEMQKTFNTPGATACNILSVIASFAGAICGFSGFASKVLSESIIKTLSTGSQSMGYVSQGLSSSGQLIEKDAEKTRILEQFYKDDHQRRQQEAGHSRDEKKSTKADVFRSKKDADDQWHKAKEGVLA